MSDDASISVVIDEDDDEEVETPSSLTISGLIAVLERRLETHGDVEVHFTWEGITRPVLPENVYRAAKEQRPGGLYLDADDNAYKDRFAQDPCEGES